MLRLGTHTTGLFFWDRFSCRPGWPQIWYTAEAGCDCLTLLPPFSTRIPACISTSAKSTVVSTETASEELCEVLRRHPLTHAGRMGDNCRQQCLVLCCLCAGSRVKIPSSLTPVLGVASTLRPLWWTNDKTSRVSEISSTR